MTENKSDSHLLVLMGQEMDVMQSFISFLVFFAVFLV